MGHVTKVVIMTGTEMKAVRVKSAQKIFRQFAKDRYVAKGGVFDANVVAFSDIKNDSTY